MDAFPEAQPEVWQRMVSTMQMRMDRGRQTSVRVDLGEADALLLRLGLVTANYHIEKPDGKTVERRVIDLNRSIYNIDQMLKVRGVILSNR
jgi:hypothetical protein